MLIEEYLSKFGNEKQNAQLKRHIDRLEDHLSMERRTRMGIQEELEKQMTLKDE